MRIGLDIGGTKTDAVVIDEAGTVIERRRFATGRGPEQVVATAVRGVTELAALAGMAPHEVASIGVGIPGQVDRLAGRVQHAVNLDVEELELGRELSAIVGAPVSVENDVKAAALGAFHLLSRDSVPRGIATRDDDSAQSMAYLNLGTGLAAGIVIGGRLWRGSRGTAGEIGHIVVDPAGVLCKCGQRGCLETVASGSAIARQWPTSHPIPPLDLFDRADQGSADARRVRHSVAQGVANAVRVLVLTVDVEDVVVGGGLTALGDRLRDDVVEVFAGWGERSPFLASLELASRMRFIPDAFPAAAVGAALVGMPDASIPDASIPDESVATVA
ncbi:ROK family protein [Okibacterium fritillariae]|uniref:ROK family protein n=1 Tax=Okibacterium fritillariae TaxID=123320 RepID=UPI0040556669